MFAALDIVLAGAVSAANRRERPVDKYHVAWSKTLVQRGTNYRATLCIAASLNICACLLELFIFGFVLQLIFELSGWLPLDIQRFVMLASAEAQLVQVDARRTHDSRVD